MLPATLAAVVLSQMSVCLTFSYTLLLLKFGAAGYTVVVAPFTITSSFPNPCNAHSHTNYLFSNH